MTRFIRLATALLLVCALAPAQSMTLTTTFANNNACYGNMFDIQATADVSLCSFDIHLSVGTATIEVWAVTGGGSWNQAGVMNNMAAWTMLSSTTVTGLGPGVPTPLNLALAYPIANGTTQGIYITSTINAAPTMLYTNGTSPATVLASDANITVFEGAGDCSGGGFTPFTTRNWNGNIHYEPTLTPTCSPPPPLWATNSPESSMDIDGVTIPGPFSGPANTDLINGAPGTVTLATSLVTNGFELAISTEPAYDSATPPGTLTANNQAVNFNLATATFLNGGASIVFSPHPGSIVVPVTLPTGVVACGQQGVVDPGHPDAFRLSQCSQGTGVMQTCVNSPTAINTGAGDDTSFAYTFVGGAFTFYGVAYTDCYVNSNGNITFTSGSTDFSETEGELLSMQPRIAPCWNDWSPNIAGSVLVEEVAGIVSTTWYQVPEFGNPTSIGSFCATLDLVTATIVTSCDGMSIQGSNNSIIGISPGGGLSGPNNIDLTMGPNLGLMANDALYEDFSQGAFGGFDAAFSSFTWLPSGATIGAGPYIQM